MTKRLDKITPEIIMDNLIPFHGNLSAIADFLDVSRSTIYRRIKESDDLAKAVADQRETTLDNLEEELFSQALAGNTQALLFALKKAGKGRGYGDINRFEIEGRLKTGKGKEMTAKEEAAHLAAVMAELDALSEGDSEGEGSRSEDEAE